MAYPEQITLDGDPYFSTTFGSTAFNQLLYPPDSEYQVAATAASAPHTLSLKNTTVSSKGISYRRSLVRLDRTIVDSLGRSVTGTHHSVTTVPLETEYTLDDVKILMAQHVAFLVTSGYVGRILAGEG